MVGKIKNTEGSAMSVGSVAVQLQYGLYVVGHLSKLAFHFMFIVVRLFVVVSSLGLLVTCLPARLFRISVNSNIPIIYTFSLSVA